MRFCTHAYLHKKLLPEAPSLYYRHSRIRTKADLRLSGNNLPKKSKPLHVLPNVPLPYVLTR